MDQTKELCFTWVLELYKTMSTLYHVSTLHKKKLRNYCDNNIFSTLLY